MEKKNELVAGVSGRVTGFFLVFLWMHYETRKVKDAVKSLVIETIKSPLLVLGFLEPKKDPNAYLMDVRVIG